MKFILCMMLLGLAIVVGFSIYIASFRPTSYATLAGIGNFICSLTIASAYGLFGSVVFPLATLLFGLASVALICWVIPAPV